MRSILALISGALGLAGCNDKRPKDIVIWNNRPTDYLNLLTPEERNAYEADLERQKSQYEEYKRRANQELTVIVNKIKNDGVVPTYDISSRIYQFPLEYLVHDQQASLRCGPEKVFSYRGIEVFGSDVQKDSFGVFWENFCSERFCGYTAKVTLSVEESAVDVQNFIAEKCGES